MIHTHTLNLRDTVVLYRIPEKVPAMTSLLPFLHEEILELGGGTDLFLGQIFTK